MDQWVGSGQMTNLINFELIVTDATLFAFHLVVLL